MNRLIYTPSPKRIFGIPSDKLFSQPLHTVELFSTNPFIPTASNNNLIYMGYAGEIEAFVKTAEHIKSEKRSSLTSLLPIYSIIEKLTNFEIEMHDKRLTN